MQEALPADASAYTKLNEATPIPSDVPRIPSVSDAEPKPVDSFMPAAERIMASETYIIGKIKMAMEIYGIRVSDLARRAGMSPNSFSETLRGKRTLTTGELVEICVVLGITNLIGFIEKERRQEAAEMRQKMVDEFGTGISILDPEWGEERRTDAPHPRPAASGRPRCGFPRGGAPEKRLAQGRRLRLAGRPRLRGAPVRLLASTRHGGARGLPQTRPQTPPPGDRVQGPRARAAGGMR